MGRTPPLLRTSPRAARLALAALALPARVAAAGLALAACATLASPPGGNDALPNAGAGPFRAIALTELGNGRTAPNALDDDQTFARDPAVVDLDGDPSTLAVAGYFAAAGPPGVQAPDGPSRVILRLDAADGRSFGRASTATAVLAPAAPWEGGTVGAPSVLRAGSGFWLYYAAAGGIGLARSPDGVAFTREPGAVLGPAASGGWEGGAAPASPGVVRLDDGTYRMFYEVALGAGSSAIGEARSDDGLTWQRLGGGPVLAPVVDAGDATTYDDASVGSPFPVLGTTEEGRRLLRLYYGAVDRAGKATIGLAVRTGSGEAFARAVSPVYGTSGNLAPREPCVLPFASFTLLFVTEHSGRSAASAYPAVAAGVAPATVKLGPPSPP